MNSCDYCDGSFVKKRSDHRFCCTPCRVKGNRQEKGLSVLPNFDEIGVSKKPRVEKIASTVKRHQIPIPPLRSSNYKYGLALLGAGLGFVNEFSPLVTMALTGAGYFVGQSIDNNNKPVYKYPVIDITRESIKKIPSPKPKSKKRILSSIDYQMIEIDTIGFKNKWLYLIGDPAHGFLMLITGRPGNGKSTLAANFGEYFNTNHGKVLFLASEQRGMNKALQELLKRSNATFDIDTQPTNNVNEIIKNSRNYKMIIIDSLNNLKLTPLDIETIRKANKKLSICLVMQSTKDGSFKGSQEFLHDCDVRIECEKMKGIQTKSRFAKGNAEIEII